MISIALIGVGYWGVNILRVLNSLDNVNIRYVNDNSPQRLKQLKMKYPSLNLIQDIAQILKDRDIQAVAIATPASTHFAIAQKILESGKDIFIEKPLAMNTRDADALIKLAEKNKRIIMVGHILQYHPAVIRLKELISQGKLGKIQYIYSNRLNIGKLRTEEDILFSFAPHDISTILTLVGEEPMDVSAFGGDYLNRGIYDTTLTTLTFKNGVKGHIFVSWLHPYKEQKLIVVGSEAMAVFDDISEEKLFIYPHKIAWEEGNTPVAYRAEYNIVVVEKKEPLKEELRHFIGCVVNRTKPKTDGYEGFRVLKVLELAENHLRKV
jgi:UDP-2-acetamido-3-amino-2,3-dideoxy-glucuronate N-acetyltransferase